MLKKVLIFSLVFVFIVPFFTFIGNPPIVSAATHLPVTLYKDANFAGTAQEFDVGLYNTNWLTATGAIGNDALSSIRILPGYQVTLYKDSNYTGTTCVLTSDDNLLSTFNDCTSGFRIEAINPVDSNTIALATFDSATIAATLKTFAPRIYLASGELYMPSSVEWSLPYLTRYYDSTVGYCYKTTEALSSPSTKLAYFSGDLASAKLYSFWVTKDYGNADLSYWVYYPYNHGKEVLGTEFGNHVGDWEHITVRLSKFTYNGVIYVKPTMVSLQAHSYVNYYTWGEYSKVSNTHPIAYSGNGSHGMWKDSGSHVYQDIVIAQLTDECSAGTTWDTWLGTVETYAYSTSSNSGAAKGTSVWPTYFNRDYTNASSQSAYYWGNMASGTLFGQERLSTGPRGPQGTSTLTDYVLLK